MKAISMNQVPKLMRVQKESKYQFVSDTVKSGKVCVIEPGDYKNENALRGGVSAHMRKLGLKYSIRKDASTGNFYVFPEKD